MKILVLGSDGQVGWELQRALAPLGQIIPLTRAGHDGLCGDLTQTKELAESIRKVAAEIIVNAAAYTAVDKAEDEAELAQTVNEYAPSVIAAEAKRLGALLIHYSTDYVFDGSGKRPWKEDDPTSPLSVYGRTKRGGDIAIQESGCRHLIFRTSWVYAPRGRNFIRTILGLASERDALQVIDDQHGAPTGAELIADVTAQAITAVLERPETGGLYHLAAAGDTTWYEYARFVIEQAREAGWPVKVSGNRIEPVKTDYFPVKATRPLNSRLDCSLLKETFGTYLPDWRIGVQRSLREMLACEIAEKTK